MAASGIVAQAQRASGAHPNRRWPGTGETDWERPRSYELCVRVCPGDAGGGDLVDYTVAVDECTQVPLGLFISASFL
jgi:hypothetical protein